ncbi:MULTISPECIES: TRAP transporter small permease [Gracilibacillus]|uniref:TRAP transporter small permease protein n=1 Tax=Gracilibacillus dipsosauri TaxID=178340 RepID=A0A317L1H0_9BACI|nr:TRAP transporter small permease [Gracilibacillus dipsosauri]PWU69495.1 TRAP transporter small permease protein [Gracilibacillus dipsosauri]
MNLFKKIVSLLNKMLIGIVLTMLGSMAIVIIIQVFSRQFFDYTPSWSEELSRLLLVWISFLGIAYGVKARLHIALGLVINKLPKSIQHLFDYFSKILIIGFGIMMIYYGYQFVVLMGASTMPGTGLPSSFLYASIPVSGFFLTLYGVELLFTKGLHQDLTEEISEV